MKLIIDSVRFHSYMLDEWGKRMLPKHAFIGSDELGTFFLVSGYKYIAAVDVFGDFYRIAKYYTPTILRNVNLFRKQFGLPEIRGTDWGLLTPYEIKLEKQKKNNP